MTYDKYNAVRKACRVFANEVENGCRNVDKRANEELKKWVERNCRERRKNSKYFIYLESCNYGTKEWSDYDRIVSVRKLSDFNETDKSFFINTDHCGGSIIRKKYVIGYLS